LPLFLDGQCADLLLNGYVSSAPLFRTRHARPRPGQRRNDARIRDLVFAQRARCAARTPFRPISPAAMHFGCVP
jgi:hypothetical protein